MAQTGDMALDQLSTRSIEAAALAELGDLEEGLRLANAAAPRTRTPPPMPSRTPPTCTLSAAQTSKARTLLCEVRQG